MVGEPAKGDAQGMRGATLTNLEPNALVMVGEPAEGDAQGTGLLGPGAARPRLLPLHVKPARHCCQVIRKMDKNFIDR